MNVIVHTENNPEDNAMLQALYSRSASSVTDHLKKLEKTGSGKFMEQFYLGYGHASIADCGFTTIYFEGISMLAAKAIEDNPLFNGQECSSRYIDFSNQPFVNPYAKDPDPKKFNVQHAYVDYAHMKLREFYTKNLVPVKEHLKTQFPFIGEVHNADPQLKATYPEIKSKEEQAYDKTIVAKAFDILRGFLPAGATTNVAWTTSLRKAHENLVLMMHHPLREVQDMAVQAYSRLYEKYSHSFEKAYANLLGIEDIRSALIAIETERVYYWRAQLNQFYATPARRAGELYRITSPGGITFTPMGYIGTSLLPPRPRKESLPRHAGGAKSVLQMDLDLDFGSFRDLQRHRGGYCSNPILDAEAGFHSWYYDNLPDASKVEAENLFGELSDCSEGILKYAEYEESEKLRLQYITPMGVLVPVNLVYSLPQTVYVAELRSGKTVHPTLRPVAQEMAKYLTIPGINVWADMDESDWTLRRGTQDIVQK